MVVKKFASTNKEVTTVPVIQVMIFKTMVYRAGTLTNVPKCRIFAPIPVLIHKVPMFVHVRLDSF